jgi:predicted amidohydrolase
LFLILAPLHASLAEEPGDALYLRVALLQMEPFGNDQSRNLAKAAEFCRQAKILGADIALMPEMFDIGYTRFDPEKPGDREAFWASATPKEASAIQMFSSLAKELDMAIGVTYLQAWDPRPRNAITLFDRHGKEVYTYAKVHTSDFKPMEASMTPGEDFYVGTLDTAVGSVEVGSMIRFDREQPESARILMLKGAEIILTPNACGLEEIRLDQFKIRACENVVGVAMANYPAPKNNGHSVAYDFEGKTLVLADEEEGVFLADFNLTQLREGRSRRIWGNAYRRPHRYGILTSPEMEEIWNRTDGNGQPYDRSQR